MNVAAVDIGTNSVRLLITDERGNELERHMQITKLGQGVDVSGRLHPDAIERTASVLREYGALTAKHGVSRVRAAATSAARDSENSEQFFDAAQAALGARPELLSGEAEAELSFRGATTGVASTAAPFLVVDIGGGSTEFVLGSERPEALISVDMGCVRMSERHLKTEPPAANEIAALLEDVRGKLADVRRAVPVERTRTMIGLAGTITATAALVQGLRKYDASRTHHARLTREQVEREFQRLCALDVAGRRAVLAEPKRAEVIVGGMAVLVAILREFGIDEVLVSETDILDGLAASLRD
ncbi:MAG TPA: Ppx/GppA phosphatase family protein [Polyangiales bacterium]|nr:Ppx/GppA phosphatase family protein [Polyangiales bacterium]